MASEIEYSERLIVSLLRAPYQAALDGVEARLRAEFPDLRPAHFIVFQLLDPPPAGKRLTELAERAQMTKPSMLELVDALERQGYVERIPDPTDRRAKLIRLTEKGWAAYTSAFHAVLDLQAAWAARLGGAKFSRFLSLLRELNDALGLRN
jgi:DNA-binding MarR family transcriptional regulator